MTCLSIDGGILDKAVPDVDGHGVASDECVDVATLITELLTNDGNGEAELRPYFLLLSFVPVVEEARIEVVDVFCEVARITVTTINVLLIFVSGRQLTKGVGGVDVEERRLSLAVVMRIVRIQLQSDLRGEVDLIGAASLGFPRPVGVVAVVAVEAF